MSAGQSPSRSFLDTGGRSVHWLGLTTARGWRLKLYGLSRGPRPSSSLIERARAVVETALPLPDGQRTPVGFVTVHAGESGDYVLVDWWDSGDLLKHRLFGAPHPSTELRPDWPPGVVACVWELAVLWHERNAWWRHVLSRPDDPDLEAYLDDRLEGTV